MKKNINFEAICLSLSLLLIGCATMRTNQGTRAQSATNIQLPKIFGDHMVLQQQARIPVWGTADPGGYLTVQLDKQNRRTIAGTDGKWRVDLSDLKAGGPHTMRIIGRDTIQYSDVMVGEVYLCSGQSNMEWPVSRVRDAETEIANATYPKIRLFKVERNAAVVPLTDVISSGWQPCSSETVTGFSAVGYLFGRDLYRELSVPIGLIQSAWGGTPAEPWTSPRTLSMLPDYKDQIEFYYSPERVQPQASKPFAERLQEWQKERDDWIAEMNQSDPGLHDSGMPWFLPRLDVRDWGSISLPLLWESSAIGNYDGIVWFRKNVTVPESWRGHSLTLHLGGIDDQDITWFNGVRVGSTDHYSAPRAYAIPDSLIRFGDNVIAVRAFDYGGAGGMGGGVNQYKLKTDTGDSVGLAGEWYYKVSNEDPDTRLLPMRPEHQPAALYHAMIAPLIPYAIRGSIWYQGESNASKAYAYRTLFPAMITDWRLNWGQGDFPFFFVQLANYMALQVFPEESNWAELREAQLMTLSLPNTGMAVIIDIGDASDIHPKNKQDVGRRLALQALDQVCKQKIESCGPLYKSMKVEGNKIRIFFDHVDGGLTLKGSNRLRGFTIAGADRKFVWADAIIDGSTVIVSGPEVSNPVAVRYAWANNPVCNLYNQANLPASPFRTDGWPGLTMPVQAK